MKKTPLFYTLDGKKPVPETDVVAWAMFMIGTTRVLKQTHLPDGRFLSTVFLGMDHGFTPKKPVLFETMLFAKPEIEGQLGKSEDSWRDVTYDQALARHSSVLKKLRKKI